MGEEWLEDKLFGESNKEIERKKKLLHSELLVLF